MNTYDFNQAEVLIQALPYIQQYAGKTVVIKYGGNAMINDELRDAFMRDVVLLSSVGINVVLVHGGGPEINNMLSRLNIQSRFVGGLRYTDEATMEVVQMVLAGKINKDLVAMINKNGGKAIGLSGLDANLITAVKHSGTDLGLVGDIESIDVSVIRDSLSNGYIPVISTVAGGDCAFNINADLAAARIAAELHAENLILLTDVRGLLEDRNDESTLIHFVNVSEVPSLKNRGVISGGMIPKIDCCVEAVRRGVHKTVITDGRVPHAILIEIFSDEGVGTMFV